MTVVFCRTCNADTLVTRKHLCAWCDADPTADPRSEAERAKESRCRGTAWHYRQGCRHPDCTRANTRAQGDWKRRQRLKAATLITTTRPPPREAD